MDLSIIIPSFNTKELLKQCLRSVTRDQQSATSKKPTTDHRLLVTEIIVVDNGSTDGSAEMMEKLIEKNELIKLIKNNKNLGFAKAVNQGIRKAQGKYLLLLNSDIVVQKDALRAMIDFAETHSLVGAIGGKLFNPDGSIQASVYHFPSVVRAIKEFWLNQEHTYQKYAPQAKGPAAVEAVIGAAMLIPRKIFEKVGFFDERYFMYFEDLDYCRRVKKAGYKTYYLPTAKFIHRHGASGRAMPDRTHQWLVESSKIYHGKPRYYLLTFIIWLGQKWQRFQ